MYRPIQNERQVPPPSPLLLMLLLQLYCFCCAMLLLLWYSDHLGLLCVPTAQIHHSYTCGTSCRPQKIRTSNEGAGNNAGCFLNTHTLISCVISAELFFLLLCLPGRLHTAADYFDSYQIYFTYFIK